MVYKFRSGARISGATAQDIGETLEAIRKKNNGMLETEAVLAAAKSKRSKIHAAFEWDDKKAGHEYRLIQVRQMIRAVIILNGDQEEPAYVHISADSLNYYQSTAVAAGNVDEWQLVRTAALRVLLGASEALDRLDAVARRVNHPNQSSISSVRGKIDQARAELQGI